MDDLMDTANIYKKQKYDQSQTAIKTGFRKSIIHGSLLFLIIIILSTYYATLREIVRNVETNRDGIPYEQYTELYDKNRDNGFSCTCSNIQTEWNSIQTKPIEIVQDDTCDIFRFASLFCYNDDKCINGFVGRIIFSYFDQLCTTAEIIYTQAIGYGPIITSLITLTNIDIHTYASQIEYDTIHDIKSIFLAGFDFNWPLISNETSEFYNWVIITTFNDTKNVSYWLKYGININTAINISSIFNDIISDYSYYVIADSIDEAFIENIYINYSYPLYYSSCQPDQCIWYSQEYKPVLAIITTIFGLIGGVHAALFILINAIDAIINKIKKKRNAKISNNVNEKQVNSEMTSITTTNN